MGLRFRKSISIFPGLKLNFGTTGMSVSAGVPGFRKTIHTSGRVTTSVGIPGTGLYYVDTKNTHTQPNRRSSSAQTTISSREKRNSIQSGLGQQTSTDVWEAYNSTETEANENLYVETLGPDDHSKREAQSTEPVQINAESLKSIHKTSDDSIDWTEVLVSPSAPDDTYNPDMWRYYHEMSSKILSGDIDSYLQLIYEVNPLDDLLSYGGNFEFGTDDPHKIEVEFTINEHAISSAKTQMDTVNFNDLLQDFVCSVCIRIARDMFALLPVANTIVHAVLNGETVLSVNFDRTTLSKIKFGYIDPSDTISLFKYNMNFDDISGFAPVEKVE